LIKKPVLKLQFWNSLKKERFGKDEIFGTASPLKTSVEFKSSDSFGMNLYPAADTMLKDTVKDFGGRPVPMKGAVMIPFG
jgi:hypothetical protein